MSLRAEAADRGVRVSAAVPGLIETGIAAAAVNLPGHDYAESMSRVPIGAISAGSAARSLLDGVERNRRLIVFPRSNAALTLANRLLPGVMEKAIAAQTREATAPPPQPIGKLARSIASALDVDPADPRGLDDWARTLHTSAMTIRRAFKAETELTWSAWRTQHRVHSAVHLLRHGARASRAAAAVGFSEAGLSAAVRRHYGCTPSALASRRR